MQLVGHHIEEPFVLFLLICNGRKNFNDFKRDAANQSNLKLVYQACAPNTTDIPEGTASLLDVWEGRLSFANAACFSWKLVFLFLRPRHLY